MNNIKFTYDKLESVKFGFSIFHLFSQVFKFSPQIKRYTTFINRFSNPLLFYTNRTNKQTNKQTNTHTQQSRFNNKDCKKLHILSGSGLDLTFAE